MSVDFRHASYQINFLRCIPSSGPCSSSMIANDHRLEAEFRIVSHAIHCNYVSQRAFESFCYVNDVYNYYYHQVASPQQSNPDHDHVATLPQYEVPCRQPAMPPHQQPQILPQRVVRLPAPINLLPVLDQRKEVTNVEDEEVVGGVAGAVGIVVTFTFFLAFSPASSVIFVSIFT